MSEHDPQENQTEAPRRGPIIAVVVIIVLVLGGLWLSHTLRSAGQIQDCVMAGRTNCAPVGR